MAKTPIQEPGRKYGTTCRPVEETDGNRFVADPLRFREWLMQHFELNPKLLPAHFSRSSA